MIIYCSRCGSKNDDDAVFCNRCGHKIRMKVGFSGDLKEFFREFSKIRLFQKAENLCAMGLIIVFFFVPCLQSLYLISPSGYELTKFGSYWNLAWLIPVGSVSVIALSFRQEMLKLHRTAGFITGLLPIILLILFWKISETGTELFHFLGIGAYLTILTGFLMVLAALGAIELPKK